MCVSGLLVSILSLHIVSSVCVFEPDRRESPGPDDYGRESFRGLRSPEATEETHTVFLARMCIEDDVLQLFCMCLVVLRRLCVCVCVRVCVVGWPAPRAGPVPAVEYVCVLSCACVSTCEYVLRVCSLTANPSPVSHLLVAL